MWWSAERSTARRPVGFQFDRFHEFANSNPAEENGLDENKKIKNGKKNVYGSAFM